MRHAKIKHFFNLRNVWVLAVASFLILCGFSAVASAQTVTQGYGADEILERGMIVMLDKNDATKVQPLTADEADRMHGVVVNANDAPVTLSSAGQKVFVATIGRFDVLVTNQNGSIKTGDYVTISSIRGIGMKASTDQNTVLGKAVSGFDGVTNVISTTNATQTDGSKKQVAIGRISVDVGVGHNPLAQTQANVPAFLRKASSSVANKQVSVTRSYLALLVLVLTAIITISILYAGIRSSISAIGRNPLSRKTISKSLFQVILTGFIIFLGGLFGVYLLLKL